MIGLPRRGSAALLPLLSAAVLATCMACSEAQRTSLEGKWVNSKEALTACIDFVDDERLEVSLTTDGYSFYSYACLYDVEDSRLTVHVHAPDGYSPSAPALFGMDRQLRIGDELEFTFELLNEDTTLKLYYRGKGNTSYFDKADGNGCPQAPPVFDLEWSD